MNLADMLTLVVSAFLTLQTAHAVTIFTTGYKDLWRTRYAILGDPASGIATYCDPPGHLWESQFFRCQLDLYWWRAGQMTAVCGDADSHSGLKAATAARRRYRLVYRCHIATKALQSGEHSATGGTATALPEVATILYR